MGSYAFRGITDRVLVLVYFGFTTPEEIAHVKQTVNRSFVHFPSVQAISIEFFEAVPFRQAKDGSYSRSKALFIGQERIVRQP